MKITIEIDLPENQLAPILVKEKLSHEQFIEILKAEFAPLTNATDLCAGGTAKITIT